MSGVKEWLRNIGIARPSLRRYIMGRIASKWLMIPYLDQEQRQMLVATGDPVRYGTLLLSIERISKENIAGSLAECGVYKGQLSAFIHHLLPDRKLFLFDTFQGFDARDSGDQSDGRFKDTSEQSVLRAIGNTENIIVRKGYFPETAAGMERETFAFVMVDFDKYDPTMAALKFFYPLVAPGGFMFVHDYSSPESDWACSRALDAFLSDKPEKAILIPDAWGSALFRKLRN